MKIYTAACGALCANSYLLTQDGKSGVLIDACGDEANELALRKGVKIEYVLLTHGHFDHVCACAALQRGGAKIAACDKEVSNVLSVNELASDFGVEVQPFKVDFTFSDGDKLSLCGMDFSVIETPGHTCGGVCFAVEDKLFTGDTLFCGSVGRSDLPTGSTVALVKSIKNKLFSLDKNYTVYPGHGEISSLDDERKNNPFVF